MWNKKWTTAASHETAYSFTIQAWRCWSSPFILDNKAATIGRRGEVAMKRNRTGKAKKNRCRSWDMSVENGYGLKDVKEQLQCDSWKQTVWLRSQLFNFSWCFPIEKCPKNSHHRSPSSFFKKNKQKKTPTTGKFLFLAGHYLLTRGA